MQARTAPAGANGAHRAVYDYRDAQGDLVRRKLRTPDKKFPWQSKTETGWADEYGDYPDTLYNLPAIMAAARDETIVVCEGEKDADALIARGRVATTPPHPGPWKEDLAEPLRGRRVAVCWDRDEAGHQRGWWAINAVHSVGAELMWVGRAAKGNDISDHLAAGLRISQLVRETPPKPQPGKRGGAAGYDEDDSKVIARLAEEAGDAGEAVERVLSLYSQGVVDGDAQLVDDAYIKSLPRPQWCIDGWVPERGMTAMWGVPGVGKSTLGDDITDCVRRGEPWNGWPVKRGGVLTLAGEGFQQYRDRVVALEAMRGNLNGAAPSIYTQDTWDITTLPGLARVVRACVQVPELVLVLVDPLGLYGTRTREGVEDTELIAKATRALGLGLDLAVLMMQHSNAPGTRGRGTEHVRMYCETYMRAEALSSHSVTLCHDGKNRPGQLLAMRFEREQAASGGPLLMCTRGERGDEYTPDDVAREHAEQRDEARAQAKERKAVSVAENPDNQERVMDTFTEGVWLGQKDIAARAGMGHGQVAKVLGSLLRDGRVRTRKQGGWQMC